MYRPQLTAHGLDACGARGVASQFAASRSGELDTKRPGPRELGPVTKLFVDRTVRTVLFAANSLERTVLYEGRRDCSQRTVARTEQLP